MIDESEIRAVKVPRELKNFIGEYYTALIHRAKKDMLGETEFRCFARFISMYRCGRYKFAVRSMELLFKYLSLLIYIDDDGKPHRLELYPVQKFIMCGIFGLRRQDGSYLTNTANIYIARRNGKSFLLSAVLHELMGASKFRNERIVLASCKGQNATICFDEFVNFIENDKYLGDTYSNVNKTACWAKNRLTGNKLEMFRTGAGAKKSLDGFTNRVAVIDEEMLCDEIITKTIQDGQAHYKDSLLVTMSTAQFTIGSDNHKKWLSLRAALYEGTLPDECFLFLCEPDREDLEKKDFAKVACWAKANPVLLYEKDGYSVKEHIKKKYAQKAKEAMNRRGFDLQNFATKQCNIWYSAEDRSLCTFGQMKNCEVGYSFEDVIAAGYKDWYLGVDLSQVLDLTSVHWVQFVGVDAAGQLLPRDATPDKHRLFIHCLSWMPKNKLQIHVEADQFPYRDYVDKELFLCTSAGGDNIDPNDALDMMIKIKEQYDLHYVTATCDPYGIAGIQQGLADICDTLILQNQSPKALSQYIEALSGLWKQGGVAYEKGRENIMEKAMTGSVMIRNPTGYYSIEKISLRANSNIRIDPVDSMLDAFIAAYIDFNNRKIGGDEAVDAWLAMIN